MSNYGQPGGPYGGQPQEPWAGRQPAEPYEQPADPWGGQNQWGGDADPASPPGYGHPAGYDSPGPYSSYPPSGGYAATPEYGAPTNEQGVPDQYQAYLPSAGGPPTLPQAPSAWPAAQPPRRRPSAGMIVGLAALLAVLAIAGAGIGILAANRHNRTASAQSTHTASPRPTVATSTAGALSQPDSEARAATKGQCLVNKGTLNKPVMAPADCGPGTYQVLARFDGTIDYAAKCSGVPEYRFYYFYDSPVASQDFVLCLKKR